MDFSISKNIILFKVFYRILQSPKKYNNIHANVSIAGNNKTISKVM